MRSVRTRDSAPVANCSGERVRCRSPNGTSPCLRPVGRGYAQRLDSPDHAPRSQGLGGRFRSLWMPASGKDPFEVDPASVCRRDFPDVGTGLSRCGAAEDSSTLIGKQFRWREGEREESDLCRRQVTIAVGRNEAQGDLDTAFRIPLRISMRRFTASGRRGRSWAGRRRPHGPRNRACRPARDARRTRNLPSRDLRSAICRFAWSIPSA